MLSTGLEQLDKILSKGKYIGNQQGLGFKSEWPNSKTIIIKSNSMSNSVTVSPILENKKPIASSVATKNTARFVTIEQKSQMSLANKIYYLLK